MENSAREEMLFTYTSETDPAYSFAWEGGSYIDVGVEGEGAMDVINVWNYNTGAPSIACTQEAFREKCDRWLRERGRAIRSGEGKKEEIS